MSQVALEVEKFLPDFGYACDVGANDGLFYSNSLLFEDKGWIVLCIEPNPLLEPSGRMARKLWRAVAAGEEDKTARFYLHGGGTYPSNSGFKIPSDKAFKVPMFRLDRLLEEAGFPRLDYLTMDVEGYEDEVFQGFTIERWKPKVIVAECWSEGREAPEGYYKHARIDFDDIFIRKDS